MNIKKGLTFKDIVDTFVSDMINTGVLRKNSADSYRTRLMNVDRWNNGNSIDWVIDAINIAKNNNKYVAISEVMKLYDEWNGNVSHTVNLKSECKTAYRLFAKWLIGQYQAKTWLSIDKNADLYFCKLIAKHALFCTRADAFLVRDGELGCRKHEKSDTFSWYNKRFRRISQKEKDKKIGEKVISDGEEVELDNNSKANKAIKSAIAHSLPIKGTFDDFSDYMACHIWDGTCYDERYYTSVFNLVLVPTAIAGLTDYNDAVKQMLQYESACRFGVYPDSKKYGDPPSKPSRFDEITIWRQQKEHNEAHFREGPFTQV